jgi:hypothetical protein
VAKPTLPLRPIIAGDWVRPAMAAFDCHSDISHPNLLLTVGHDHNVSSNPLSLCLTCIEKEICEANGSPAGEDSLASLWPEIAFGLTVMFDRSIVQNDVSKRKEYNLFNELRSRRLAGQ